MDFDKPGQRQSVSWRNLVFNSSIFDDKSDIGIVIRYLNFITNFLKVNMLSSLPTTFTDHDNFQKDEFAINIA